MLVGTNVKNRPFTILFVPKSYSQEIDNGFALTLISRTVSHLACRHCLLTGCDELLGIYYKASFRLHPNIISNFRKPIVGFLKLLVAIKLSLNFIFDFTQLIFRHHDFVLNTFDRPSYKIHNAVICDIIKELCSWPFFYVTNNVCNMRPWSHSCIMSGS